MKKTSVFIIGIMIILGGIFIFKNSIFTGNVTSEDIQKITLSFKDYNYYPTTLTVEANKPVEIKLDSSIQGCFRSFNIRALGIRYNSLSPSDTIKFTPTQKGSFEFACGMRMGYGTINVI